MYAGGLKTAVRNVDLVSFLAFQAFGSSLWKVTGILTVIWMYKWRVR